jgi:chromosome segregation ATPase
MRLTIVRSPAVLVPLAIACVAPAVHAQQGEAELLRAIVCEIRELRSVIQQGHILVPLLEANRREREYSSEQLATVEEQLRRAREHVERWLTNQRNARNALQELKRAGRQDLDREEAAKKKEYEEVLKHAELEIPRSQGEEARLSSEAGQIRERMSRLEDEFDRMQRQMQAMATAAGTVCESKSQ